jgi:ribosome-associated protein
MIVINDRVSLDEDELVFEFIRASGPGGQNVNKVATAVRLRFDARGSLSLPDDVRQRLIGLAGRRLGDDGFLTLHARSKRTQEANRREAVDRLVELLQRACERPKARRQSRPTRASKERRLETKRRHGEAKARRRSLGSGNE